ncbi:CHAP domain-containing protein [Sphingomonas jatrophae]|uniref:CHAP domain-containing protein n=1 Tax=Sphingomonas jatrophae TaxID=1166337 RepID=UPI001F60913E|nr:CHAP domain-containing protein [Sphingomonas jatrophae]
MLLCLGLLAAPLRAERVGPAPGTGECVPFARAISGVRLYGDAWSWWDKAEGVYARGARPEVGAVLVFRAAGAMRLGHVAVVSRVIDPRIVMVTHANWSRIGGQRGQIERDVTMTDVSDRGDWSRVKVWYDQNDGLGGSTYPTYGFIYGRAAGGARVQLAHASPELTGTDPDIIGSVIDTIR